MVDGTVTVRLCGGVVVAVDGEVVDVGPAKCQEVLASLALTPGVPVSQRRLVELVWGVDPPASAERTLQSYIARIRKALGPDSILREGGSYRLAVATDAVDVARFEQHLDHERTSEALTEWTGPLLDGLDAPGLEPAVAALTERWLDAVETDLRRRLESEPATVISRLTELTAQHPFREQLWALLMTALYRSGRQADALAAYRSAHRHLVEQLGLEPGPELRELERMVLGHDERLGAVRSHEQLRGRHDADHADSPTTGPADRQRRGNAPAMPGHLVGRDNVMATINDAVADYPVVTLVGPGGIGKTSLAVAFAARAAADREAWVVELADVRSGALVERVVADTLGISEGETRAERTPVVRALAHRTGLVVLDNCEHVLAAAAEIARLVVAHCPGMRVLATSRERLGLTNERVVSVEPLDSATTAVELFNRRASALANGFDVEASRVDVEAICRRLSGIPLAIELAAARTTSLTTTELRQRLDSHHGLRLLGNATNRVQRHDTMRAAIGWSHDLLTVSERTVFERLAVFTSAFELAAAEAVAADVDLDAIEVDRLLGNLVDRSMIAVENGTTGRRFRLLDPIREFGIARLDESGREREAQDRHTRWCLSQLEEIGGALAGWNEIEGVARLDELWPELRSAVDRALARHDRELVQRLVRPILGEIVLRSRYEIADWLERLLDITPHDHDDIRVFALYWAAHRYGLSQDPSGYQRLVDLYGEPDHLLMEHGRAFATGDYETQARTSPDAGRELRRQGLDHLAERTDINVAASLLNLGRYDEQEVLTQDLVVRYRQQGPPTYLNWSLMLLGYNAQFRGRPDQADSHFNDAIDIEVPARTHSPNRPHRGSPRPPKRPTSGGVSNPAQLHRRRPRHRQLPGRTPVAIEFVNMMIDADRVDAATAIVDYLETTGLLDNHAWRSLVAAATNTIRHGPDEQRTRSRRP